MTENQEWESWEPQDPGAWLEVDPLSRLATGENQTEFQGLAGAALAAYRRLPAFCGGRPGANGKSSPRCGVAARS